MRICLRGTLRHDGCALRVSLHTKTNSFSVRSERAFSTWVGSSVQRHEIQLGDGYRREVFIKRDDLLFPEGNKARKLYWLLSKERRELSGGVISYGGAQSNAMLALAQICALHQVPFAYLTKEGRDRNAHLNFTKSNLAGMRLIEVPDSSYRELDAVEADLPVDLHLKAMEALRPSSPQGSPPVWIPRGGSHKEAVHGVKILAEELLVWAKSEDPNGRYLIVLPSGTGATALLLNSCIQEGIGHGHSELKMCTATVPCVGGGASHLRAQWDAFTKSSNRFSQGFHSPEVWSLDDHTLEDSVINLTFVHPSFGHRKAFSRQFAKPDIRYWHIHQYLLAQTGVTFDLIYAPRAWLTLMARLKLGLIADDVKIVYIHTGGVTGNESQRRRYKLPSKS